MNNTTASSVMVTRPKCYMPLKVFTVEFLDSYLLVTHYVTGSLNAVFIVMATIINILILVAVIKKPNLRTPSTLLLCSNVIKDLLVVSILQPVAVYRSFAFLATDSFCNKTPADDIRPFLVFFYRCISQSLWIMISIDRWLAIRRASIYRSVVTRKRAYLSTGFIWIFCLVLSYVCTYITGMVARYLLVFIQFGVTSLVIMAIQISVYRSIKAHGNAVGAVSSVQATQAAIERRIAGTVAYSIIAVAVIYFPIMTMAMIYYLGDNYFLMSSPWLEMLLLSNALISPVIWLKTSDQMRKAVLQISCLPKGMFNRQVAPVNPTHTSQEAR